MRTSLTLIMPSFRIVKVSDPYEVIFFPCPTRLGCVLLCDRWDQNYFVHNWRGQTLDFVMESAWRDHIPFARNRQGSSISPFSFICALCIYMETTLIIFGDDNDHYWHSLIRCVLRYNARDVINWGASRGPGKRSHPILWLSDRAQCIYIKVGKCTL
jgi:hypothetical protein